MADCNETLRELDAFLDSELAEHTRLAIRAHLDGCPDCLQAFDFHAELKIVVRQKCRTDEMPSGLLAKLEACFGGVDELDADDRRGGRGRSGGGARRARRRPRRRLTPATPDRAVDWPRRGAVWLRWPPCSRSSGTSGSD